MDGEELAEGEASTHNRLGGFGFALPHFQSSVSALRGRARNREESLRNAREVFSSTRLGFPLKSQEKVRGEVEKIKV